MLTNHTTFFAGKYLQKVKDTTRAPLNNMKDVEEDVRPKKMRVTMFLNKKKDRIILLSKKMPLNMNECRTTQK